MAILKRKPGVTTQPGKTTTSGPVKGADAFMSRLKSATAAPAGFDIIPGQYEALCYKAGEYSEGQKEAIWIEFSIVNDQNGKMDGKTGRIYYQIKDKDGLEGNGFEYMKRDLENLGFEMDGYTSQADFIKGLEAWADQEAVWVVIDVKKNGQFTNIYLNSVMDDQASKPDLIAKA